MESMPQDQTYKFQGKEDLTASELLFWVFVDQASEHFGTDEVAAIVMVVSGRNNIPTRQKPRGAIDRTSIASLASRKALRGKRIPGDIKLPTLVGTNVFDLRIRMVRNLGAFVGRTIPVVGWLLLAADVGTISYKSIRRYNQIAIGDDKIWD